MLFHYPMIVHEEDGFWAEFPDLDGCHAWGDTFEELYNDALGALDTHIYSILIDGDVLNKPSNPKDISLEENSYIVIMTIDVDINKENNSVKKTLTIPYWINKKAEMEGINFSKTLQEALINKFLS